jgi:hypothetical protein
MNCLICVRPGSTHGTPHDCRGTDHEAVTRWVLLMFGETPPDEYVCQIAEDGSTLGHAVTLARAALAAPPSGTARACTGLSARWCPVHGDCTCATTKGSDWPSPLDSPSCPLHGPTSKHAEPAPRPLAETPRAPVPPALLADLRARVVGRELGASPEVCLDVGRAYLASEPAPASRSAAPCPGPRCPMCSGEACALCGPSLAADVALGKRAPCEHDVMDRHGDERAPASRSGDPGARIPWQCSGCGWGFPAPWRKTCPACGREDYWTGSVHPEAKLWAPPPASGDAMTPNPEAKE